MRIVITDLTRFRKQDKVCIGGVTEKGDTIRPMPYLATQWCERLKIRPGGILEGKFRNQNADPPHVEDSWYDDLGYCGSCSLGEFQAALEATLFEDASAGFECELKRGQKYIPLETRPVRSLITIKAVPQSFEIVRNHLDSRKLKVSFKEENGLHFSSLPITDLEFFDFLQRHLGDRKKFDKIVNFFHGQNELFLRVGLSRAYRAPDGRHGYWIQVNGIYTLPNYTRQLSEFA